MLFHIIGSNIFETGIGMLCFTPRSDLSSSESLTSLPIVSKLFLFKTSLRPDDYWKIQNWDVTVTSLTSDCRYWSGNIDPFIVYIFLKEVNFVAGTL